MSSFCRKCGIRLREGAAFCPKCGEVTRNGLANKNVDTKTVASKLVGNLVASSEPGMSFVDMGTLGFGEIINTYNLTGHIGGITGNAQAILSPFRTFTSVISRAGAGLRNIKKRPAALIPVIGLIIVWLSLFTFRHSGSEESFFTDLLSFASFGWGSPDRSPVGAIGTSIGMGTVSAFFVSLFSGGISRFGDGIRKLKDKSVISSGKGWSVVGAGASLIIYTFKSFSKSTVCFSIFIPSFNFFSFFSCCASCF